MTRERLDPTPHDRCGENAGYGRHMRLGERACDPCAEAHAEYMAAYVPVMDRKIQQATEAAAKNRPTMIEVLVAHQRQDAGSCLCGWADLGRSHAEHQVAELAKHGYGDHAEALEAAARECPVGRGNHVPGSAVRAWLFGRAELMRGII